MQLCKDGPSLWQRGLCHQLNGLIDGYVKKRISITEKKRSIEQLLHLINVSGL